jgi:maltoporin
MQSRMTRTLWFATVALALVASVSFGAASSEASEAAEPASVPEATQHGFSFGSYGRVVGASNLRGGSGKQLNVVSFGPRLDESPYLELDFRYRFEGSDGLRFDVVTTTAITDALFHLDGEFDGAIALRNAYVQASSFGLDGFRVWAGSRMLRGDDIYLLDFWPLDNLNTVGGGASYAFTETTTLSLHGGVNQLRDRFQYQEIEVAGPSFDTEQRIQVDRLRALGSIRFEQQFRDIAGTSVGAKAVAYGEVHSIGSGTYRDDNDVEIGLPSELGYTVGLQAGAWGFAPNAFVNVFLRHSRGLAAYGELAVPQGTSDGLRVRGAQLTRLAMSFNVESRYVGVTGGGYLQWFRDADDVAFDPDDYSEGVFAVRPVLFATDHIHQAFEFSYQRRRPQGLSARTDTYLEPAIWKVGVMPTISLDRGVYSRPQIRLIYSASFLNAGAQDRYPPGDMRHENAVHHFLGAGVEWWFNSSTYE